MPVHLLRDEPRDITANTFNVSYSNRLVPDCNFYAILSIKILLT
jgi:hypothetical protein